MNRASCEPRIAIVWLIRILAIALLFGIWVFLNGPGGVSRIILPSPSAVSDAFASLLNRPVVWSGLVTTLTEIFSAFLLASVGGIAFGFWAARKVTRAKIFESMLAWGYMVPLVLFYPIFVLWFGVDISSKIAYATTSAFFPIAYNSLRGFNSI